MNASMDNLQQPQEKDAPEQKKESIFKNYWFLTLILMLVIAIGFVIVLLLLRNKTDKNGTQINKTTVEYTIKNTNITIPINIGDCNVKIDIIRDNSVENKVQISSSLLRRIGKSSTLNIYTNDKKCKIDGPIRINDISINSIEATIIDAKEDLFQITDKYFTKIFGTISIKDGILEITQVVSSLSQRDKSIMWFYFIGISFIVYLVCVFMFSETIVITYNRIDKYVLIITGVALALYSLLAKEFAGSDFIKWVTYIAIIAGIITLLFTIIANLPNPLYTLLGLIAKLFIIYAIVLIVMLMISIAIIALFFSIVSRSNENQETWEIRAH